MIKRMSHTRDAYASIGDFAGFLNPRVMNPVDPANPLTYSIIPTYNSLFLHGAGISDMTGRTWGRAVQNFMAEYAAGLHPLNPNPSSPWDGFCEAYVRLNTDTSWANSAAIDQQAYTACMTIQDIKPTQGQQMIRNACERRFLDFRTTTSFFEPFDFTVANSPLVRWYTPLYVPGPVVIRNLGSPEAVDRDSLVVKMMENPGVCTDVLVRIYLARKSCTGVPGIRGTALDAFLDKNKDLLEMIAGVLRTRINGYGSYTYVWPFPEGGGMPDLCSRRDRT